MARIILKMSIVQFGVPIVGLVMLGCVSRYQEPQKTYVYLTNYHAFQKLSRPEFEIEISSLESKLSRYANDKNVSLTWVNGNFDLVSNEIKKCYYTLAKFEEDVETIESMNKDPRYVIFNFSGSVNEAISDVKEYIRLKTDKLAEINNSIKKYDERFRVDQQKYASRLTKRREQLLSLINSYGVPKDNIYSDDIVVAYLESAVKGDNRIAFNINSFKILPHEDIQLDNFRLPMRQVSSTCKVSNNAVWLFSSTDRNYGSPTNVDCSEKVGKETRIRYLSVSFDGSPDSGETLKIEIERLALLNQKKISFSLPASLVKEVDSGKDASSSNDLSDKDFGIISCRKSNDHLIVPANINIHGKDIKVDLLLDTGASMTTIPLKHYLAGNPKEISSLEKKDFLTANGRVSFPTDILPVSTTAFSKSIEVAISEDNNLGLLGSNYFKGTVFTVDADNECIYVHASENKSK